MTKSLSFDSQAFRKNQFLENSFLDIRMVPEGARLFKREKDRGCLNNSCWQRSNLLNGAFIFLAVFFSCLTDLVLSELSEVNGILAHAESEEAVIENTAGIEDELSQSQEGDHVVGITTTFEENVEPEVIVEEDEGFGEDMGAASSNTGKPIVMKVDNVQLPMGDINILYLTDLHGWVASHAVHEPHFDADLGDIVSFYNHVRAHCDSKGKDLFFIANGDFSGGTAFPFETMIDIIQHVPLDVITLGDEDISNTSKIKFLLHGTDDADAGSRNDESQSFVDHWGRKLVTTNLFHADQKESFGKSHYYFLKGPNKGSQILLFSFIDDTIPIVGDDTSSYIFLEHIRNIVHASWFERLVSSGCPKENDRSRPLLESTDSPVFDAILILAHMDMDSEQITHILDKIRTLCGSDMPVQFLAGHTHYRGVKSLDDNSNVLEGGKFLDTLSFVSFPMAETVRDTIANQTKDTLIASSQTKSITDLYQHAFIDANLQMLHAVLNLDELSYEGFQTPNGKALSDYIHSTEDELGLNAVLGCSPQSFYVDRQSNSTESLIFLYTNTIIPRQLLDPLKNTQSGWYDVSALTDGEPMRAGVFIQSTRSMFDYDLFDGVVTFNDIVTLVSHEIPIFEVTLVSKDEQGQLEPLTFETIQKLIQRLSGDASLVNIGDARSPSNISVAMGNIEMDPAQMNWILYCTQSDFDSFADNLRIITSQDVVQHPVLLVPIELDEQELSENTKNIASIPVTVPPHAPLVIKEPTVVTTRSLWINFVQQSWGECRDELALKEEAEQAVKKVSKIASYALLALVVASMCSSFISCGSVFVFVSIWCQQKCWTPWQKRRNHVSNKKHKKKNKSKSKKIVKQKMTQDLEFQAVHYDSDSSSAASSQRSFV